jgi:uncharacterized protein YcbX
VTSIFIRELWIYPIKSLGGVRVDAAAITSAGSLELDREWIVIDSESRMVWQGDIPRMTLVHLTLDEAALTLAMEGMVPFRLARDHAGAPAALTMYKRDFTGIDAGDEAAAWLSAALGKPLRLIRIGDAAHRWSGLNPVHVVSDASITALNEALQQQGDEPVTAMRFRPNVILGSAGLPDAWLEENHAVLDFGDARIALREPCVRCELPNISLVDASRGKQPLKIIGRLSQDRPAARPASFGIYCAAEGSALRFGMMAEIA